MHDDVAAHEIIKTRHQASTLQHSNLRVSTKNHTVISIAIDSRAQKGFDLGRFQNSHGVAYLRSIVIGGAREMGTHLCIDFKRVFFCESSQALLFYYYLRKPRYRHS